MRVFHRKFSLAKDELYKKLLPLGLTMRVIYTHRRVVQIYTDYFIQVELTSLIKSSFSKQFEASLFCSFATSFNCFTVIPCNSSFVYFFAGSLLLIS